MYYFQPHKKCTHSFFEFFHNFVQPVDTVVLQVCTNKIATDCVKVGTIARKGAQTLTKYPARKERTDNDLDWEMSRIAKNVQTVQLVIWVVIPLPQENQEIDSV